MSKQFTTFILLIFMILILTGTSTAAPVLDNVHYMISGDGNKINSLNFNMNYDLDSINSFDAYFTYYDGEIKLEGSWLINFLKRPNNNMNLELILTAGLSDITPKPALGLSGKSNYQAGNKLYWGLKYFIKETNKNFVYEGGLILPVNNVGKITLGFGNSYWYIDQPQINIGLMVDF